MSASSNVIIQLRTLDVLPFEGNPRQNTNERIGEIRESIRKQGLNNTIKVTKGGNRTHYVTAAGGCSRLTALHQLASGFPVAGVPEEQIQADAKRFEFTDFILHPYVSESDLLARHMSENTQRSDMTFWDTATGFAVMRRQMEQEQNRTFSHADYANALAAVGLKADKNNVALYAFTATYYEGLSPDHRNALSRDDIRNGLRPGFYVLSGLWEKHGKADFDEHYLQWVILFTPPDNKFSAAALQTSIQNLAAAALGYSPEQFISLVAAYKVNRDAPLVDLIGVGSTIPDEVAASEMPVKELPPVPAHRPTSAAPVTQVDDADTEEKQEEEDDEPVRTVFNDCDSFQAFNEALAEFARQSGLDGSHISPNEELPFGYEVTFPDREFAIAIDEFQEGGLAFDGLSFLAALSGQEVEEPVDAAVMRRVLLDSPLTSAAMQLITEMQKVYP